MAHTNEVRPLVCVDFLYIFNSSYKPIAHKEFGSSAVQNVYQYKFVRKYVRCANIQAINVQRSQIRAHLVREIDFFNKSKLEK